MLKRVSTGSLLVSGIVGAILFPTVVLIQAVTREAFNLAVHPLSMLSLGAVGWIQITNFVVAGLLGIMFAVGLRRVARSTRGGVWGPRLIGFNGVANIAAGVFIVDPMYGFPPGAPEGLPETLSWHAILHNLTFVIAFFAVIVAMFVFARRFASLGQRGFASYCAATGVTAPMLIVVSQTAPDAAGYVLFALGAFVNVWMALLGLKMLTEHRGSQEAGRREPVYTHGS